jgi:hypothetical protein
VVSADGDALAEGRFLVWERKPPNKYAMTLVFQGRVTHHQVVLDGETGGWLINKKAYTSLTSLTATIEALKQPVPGWPVPLTAVVPVQPGGVGPTMLPTTTPPSAAIQPVMAADATIAAIEPATEPAQPLSGSPSGGEGRNGTDASGTGASGEGPSAQAAAAKKKSLKKKRSAKKKKAAAATAATVAAGSKGGGGGGSGPSYGGEVGGGGGGLADVGLSSVSEIVPVVQPSGSAPEIMPAATLPVVPTGKI